MRHLIAALEKTGQADRLRHVYHRIIQPKKLVRLEVGDRAAQFWVPTRKSEMDIVYFTEIEQLQGFLSLLRDGDVMWDVGANMGVYSMFSGERVSPAGQVLCFEPAWKLRAMLKVNRGLNRLRDRVVIVPLALGSITGKAVLYESAVTMGTHSLVKRFDDYRSKEKAIQIEISRGDDLVDRQRLQPPNAIKIDVEGAEYDVCEGLRGLIETTPPRVIFLEVHPTLLGNFGRSVEDLRSLLTGFGYQIADGGARGTEYHWTATRM